MGARGKPHLLGSLPLGELAEALLAGPDGGVDDLEEELPSARVEDEDGTVDGLCGQVALKCLVDGHPVHVGIIHKPDDLCTTRQHVRPLSLHGREAETRQQVVPAQLRGESSGWGAHLVGEELAIVLGGEVGLCGLRGVQLEALADALTQHIQRRVGLHDLGHRLDDQRLDALKPVPERAVQVVRQVDANHHPCKQPTTYWLTPACCTKDFYPLAIAT